MIVVTAGFGADIESPRIRERGTSPYVVESREAPQGSLHSKTSTGLKVTAHPSYVLVSDGL